MNKNPIKFGTDGWRGIIAEDFTFENVRFCAQGVADYLKQAGLAGQGVVIGYDTRFASEDFAAAAAEVVAGNGIIAYLSPHSIPTPVVSFGVINKKAGGGIVITASHNPAKWNGFKFRVENGTSASSEVLAELENQISRAVADGKVNQIPLVQALGQGLVEYLDLPPAYLDRIARFVDLDALRQAKLKVVIDPMYGSGAGYLKTLLDGGTIEVIEINSAEKAQSEDRFYNKRAEMWWYLLEQIRLRLVGLLSRACLTR